jgi:hypothetical protein
MPACRFAGVAVSPGGVLRLGMDPFVRGISAARPGCSASSLAIAACLRSSVIARAPGSCSGAPANRIVARRWRPVGASLRLSAGQCPGWVAACTTATCPLRPRRSPPPRDRPVPDDEIHPDTMLVQQVVGIVTEPLLIPPGEQGGVKAAAGARLLVIGLSERWRDEGIPGTSRAQKREGPSWQGRTRRSA